MVNDCKEGRSRGLLLFVLQAVQEIHGLLGMGGCPEDGALVVFQDFEP